MTSKFDISDLLQDLDLPNENNSTNTLATPIKTNVQSDDTASTVQEEQATERFQKVSPVFVDGQNPFNIPGYLQDCVKDEERGQITCETMQKFLQAEDNEERTRLRGLLIGQYWDLLASVAQRAGTATLTPAKKSFLRFAMLSPNLVSPEQRELLSKIPIQSEPSIDKNIFYLDEWLAAVAEGSCSPSMMGEMEITNYANRRKNVQNVRRSKLDEQINALKFQIKGQNERIRDATNTLQNHVTAISRRSPDPIADGEQGEFNEQQRRCMTEISNLLREITAANRTLKNSLNELHAAKKKLSTLAPEDSDDGDAGLQHMPKMASQEAHTMRQMVKLCVGRSGNHFPILFKSHFPGVDTHVGSRENINNILAEVEYLDQSIFLRTFRSITQRIPPYMILAPSYGNLGICWEIFEKQNRATSHGRLIIPMYPRDLKIALIAALGDLRWQQAKEQASRFWMQEGITGWYYDYYTKEKLKGDIKNHFISDYVTWINKESNGTQQLHREVRDIFWRYLPFPQDLKDKLKNQGYVYQQLYQKDKNRTSSSMY